MDTETLIKELLKNIGENPDREGLKDTPKRVAKMYEEIFKGYDESQKPVITTFPNGQDGVVYDQMIIDEGQFFSMCEHHIVPMECKYFFSYIPHLQGKILGLSKVARVVDYYASRLQVQERIGAQVIEELWYALTYKSKFKIGNERIEPLGMALTIRGKHFCKCSSPYTLI